MMQQMGERSLSVRRFVMAASSLFIYIWVFGLWLVVKFVFGYGSLIVPPPTTHTSTTKISTDAPLQAALTGLLLLVLRLARRLVLRLLLLPHLLLWLGGLGVLVVVV